MFYGHMTLNSASTSIGQFSCEDCAKNFTETDCKREDCDDNFGGHSWYNECCPYCGSESIFEGKIYLNKSGESVARKNHLNEKGEVKIPKGKRYSWCIQKGYQKVDNKHIPFYFYWKWVTR